MRTEKPSTVLLLPRLRGLILAGKVPRAYIYLCIEAQDRPGGGYKHLLGYNNPVHILDGFLKACRYCMFKIPQRLGILVGCLRVASLQSVSTTMCNSHNSRAISLEN
jgi:hypothetical protein